MNKYIYQCLQKLLSNSTEFEDVTNGRIGANLIDYKNIVVKDVTR